jgi:hypothetical protein
MYCVLRLANADLDRHQSWLEAPENCKQWLARENLRLLVLKKRRDQQRGRRAPIPTMISLYILGIVGGTPKAGVECGMFSNTRGEACKREATFAEIICRG